jgi:hypothetical protein
MTELAAGFTRLYRVEPAFRASIPDWRSEHPLMAGILEAQGRWFVSDPTLLDWYLEDSIGRMKTIFVDVPTADLESYRVSNSTERIGPRSVRSYSKDPDNEFFLPRELSDTRQEAPELETLRSNDQERER